MLLTGLFGFSRDTVYLSPAPLYHAAPAGWTTGTQRIGGTVVVMEHFDAIELLAAIERHRVTHLQVVPTHLVRLLKLPAEVRARYDLSSLQLVVHAAAPCPVAVKRAALEWLGPIIHEYYAGSEGNGFCAIGPEEWLTHPGSVGRSLLGAIHIVGPDGDELPAGAEGEVWFESPRRFEYHGDPAKTASAWNDAGWSTIGDIGTVDAEGFLYLTDRASNMIISGGVNIYPREIEDVLLGHPAVLDAAVIGTPDADLGEQVTAFVQPDPAVGADARDLPAELIAYCRSRLAHFKCPRRVEIVDELPRLPTGKLLKRLLR
jgi:acyl-CoA synthetase (AMP-forming)/AMP-acid ligase II